MQPYATLLHRQLIEYHLIDRYPELQPILKKLEKNKISESRAKILLRKIEPLVKQQQIIPNFLARSPSFEELYPEYSPDIIIGTVQETNIPLGLSLCGNMNSILAGRSGSGKTTGKRNIINSIFKHNELYPEDYISLISYDSKGGDDADFAQKTDSCYHFGLDTIKIDTAPPVGVPDDIWDPAESTLFGTHAKLITSVVCYGNMKRFGTAGLNSDPSQRSRRHPDPRLLHEIGRKVPLTAFATKPEAYGRALVQMLEGWEQSSKIFETFAGLDLDRDIVQQKRSAVIDICGLGPPWVKALSQDLLILKLLLGRQYRYERTSRINTVICIDESDRYVSEKSEALFPDLSPISLALKQGREYGIAIILCTSALGPMSRMVLTNASHYFFFAMADAESLREAKQTLLLPPHAEMILPSLEPGECLYRGPGPWPHAMLAKINDLPVSRMGRPEKFDTHEFIPSQPLEEISCMQQAVKALTNKQNNNNPKSTCNKNISKKADIFFGASAKADPFTPTAKIWSVFPKMPSRSTKDSIFELLEDQGLVTFLPLRIGSSNQTIPVFSQKGAKKAGIKFAPAGETNEGVAHKAGKFWVKKAKLKEGLKVYEEKQFSPKRRGDVVVEDANGRLHIFEIIATSKRNIISHLKLSFECPQVEDVTIVTFTSVEFKDIKKQIKAEPDLAQYKNHILFECLDKYLKALWG